MSQYVMPWPLASSKLLKVLELGGGERPMFTENMDLRKAIGVTINQDISEPFAIESGIYDGVYCSYALEHVSWRKVPSMLSEIFRILKSGGLAVFITSNTEAQMRWALKQEEVGDKVAQCLFGDLDYAENSHKAALSPQYAQRLFREAGFSDVLTMPHGEFGTDMIIEARKRISSLDLPGSGACFGTIERNKCGSDGPYGKCELLAGHDGKHTVSKTGYTSEKFNDIDPVVIAKLRAQPGAGAMDCAAVWTPEERKRAYNRHYFDGGRGGFGGYTGEGYRDFPVHWTTFAKLMEHKPESVLELGCGRGYMLKRFQDAGISARGLEVSRHCYLTRACDGVKEWDLVSAPWPFNNKEFDLVYSMATLEHIPEQFVETVLREAARVSRRGIHGVDFGQHDDGQDKTHCTLRSHDWWFEYSQRCFGVGGSIVDKEDFERGPVPFPPGDGTRKLNLGCHRIMAHHGWTNIDILPLNEFANQNGYLFSQGDLLEKFPYLSASVDLIVASHVLEHFTYEEGLKFLRECHRVMKQGATMRVTVPSAKALADAYLSHSPGFFPVKDLSEFDELSDACAASKSIAERLWHLLFDGHKAIYDVGALVYALEQATFKTIKKRPFRQGHLQIQSETQDMFPDLSLFVEAIK